MAITPDEIRNKTFSIHRRGYDQQEVNRYLAAVADELVAFNQQSAVAQDDVIVAEVLEGQEADAEVDTTLAAEAVAVPDDISMLAPEPTATASVESFGGISDDEFDRVGTEISIMLRQAQESAMKIRSDAEAEARTLVDQIRLDIEADRLAHEQAAGELISRTEERASEIRTEAEDYSTQTRTSADTYSDDVRQRVDTEKTELTAQIEADRKLAADKLSAASEDAEQTLASARKEADEIRAKAEADAKAQADEMLDTARSTLSDLLEAEKTSRSNLEEARANIEGALNQLRLTSVSDSALGG